MWRFLQQRFALFRRDAVVLWFAFRNPQTPGILKLASLGALLYLISPLDLIPITIPVLGVLDDLIIVPWLTGAIARRLPSDVQQASGEKAERWISRWVKRPLLFFAILILALILIWAGLLWLIYHLIWG